MQISLDLITNLEGHSGAGRGLKKLRQEKKIVPCEWKLESYRVVGTQGGSERYMFLRF